MRGRKMAGLIISKIDRFINYLTVSVMIGGALFVHILTALTIKSYYGSPWGYLSFLLPGFSELYLVTLQLTESMYNYMLILTGFLAITATLSLIWFIKNIVKSKIERTAEI